MAYGDMVLWDNRSVMHKANPDYDMNERRYLYRLMLKGEPPIPVAAGGLIGSPMGGPRRDSALRRRRDLPRTSAPCWSGRGR